MSKVYSYEQFLRKQREKQAVQSGLLFGISSSSYELWRNPSTVSTGEPLTMEKILALVDQIPMQDNDLHFVPFKPYCPFCYDPSWRCGCMTRMMRWPQLHLVHDEEELDPEDYDAVHDAWERNDE